jgi:hypothetical protein
MARISTYPVDGIISTDDFVIGSDAENVNITRNFTVGGILSLADLQAVLDNGNTATSNIVLTGNVSATNVAASAAVSAVTGNITTVNATAVNASSSMNTDELEVTGRLYDGTASEGTNGQFLKSTASGILWATLPPPQIAGWNRFDDDQYTSVSPLEVLEGAPVVLPNDGVKFSDSYGSAVFYNPAASEILAINEDDTYIITVMFKAVSSNAANTYMDLSMSGPAGYDRIFETLTFPKGNGVPQNFNRVYQYYADADFITNGAQLEIEVVGATVEVYDIIYFIQRVQIA